MGKVINLPVITRLDLQPERVLQAAIDEKMSAAVIIGYDKDDGFYFASSLADGGDVLWLLETAKKALLAVGEE